MSLTTKEILEHLQHYEKQLKKTFKKGIDDNALSPLYWKDGSEAPITVLRYLFFINKTNIALTDPIAIAIYDNLDKTACEPLANEILKIIQQNGSFYAKNKRLFVPAAILGGDDFIDAVKMFTINNKNATAPTLLGLQGSRKAARALAEIMEKFRVKYRNVQKTAKKASAMIAAKMGITYDELQDEMIPDFGFQDMFYHFEVNGKVFRAFIGSDYKLKYLDENDKIRKSPPSKAEKTLKDHFKVIGKEVRGIVKQQKTALENYMLQQRKWTFEKWEKHFMQKPLMFAFAQTLIWGVYNEKKELIQTFGVAQDGTLEDLELEEIEIEEGQRIGIVHTIVLDKEDEEEWLRYLEDNEIVQPFQQLGRSVNQPPKDILEKRMIKTYRGEATSSLISRGEKRGWRRGSVVDAGYVTSYMKEFPEIGLDVFLKIEGMSVGYSYECTFEQFYFVKHGSVTTGSYTYDDPESEMDHRLVRIKFVPLLIYSEVINDLEFFLGKK